MARQRQTERLGALPREMADISAWPDVDETVLNARSKDMYQRRKRAVTDYLSGVDVDIIQRDTGYPPPELVRLTKRCLTRHPDGAVFGFRALIPGMRVSPYRQRRPIEKAIHSGAGALGELFRRYPTVQQTVESLYRRKAAITGRPGHRMPVKEVHIRFLDACRTAGVPIDSYPFTTESQGREALRRYLHSLQDRQSRQGAESTDQPKAADPPRAPAILRAHARPLSVCQLDAHRIDTHCSVLISGPSLVPVRVPLPRLWLLVLADTASRAALGHHLSLHTEYTQEDVLCAIRNAILPWHPRALAVPKMQYKPGAGFPSGVIRAYRGALMDCLQMDNAMANRAGNVVEKFLKRIHGMIHFGPSGIPEVRNDIESLFGTFASEVHRLPSTSGSHPHDPRRSQGAADAVKYQVDLHHLEDLIDVLLANYNATPTQAHGQSPIEYLSHFSDRLGPLIRRLPEEDLARFTLAHLRIPATIRARDRTSHRPYVHYAYADYSSPYLSAIPSLIGKQVILTVDMRDVRFVDVYLNDTGAYLGQLQVEGNWRFSPHSLRTRKVIARACRRGKLKISSQDDPVMAYLSYLKNAARTNGHGAHRAVDIARELSSVAHQDTCLASGSDPARSEHEKSETASNSMAPVRRPDIDAARAPHSGAPRQRLQLRPWTSIIKK